MLKRLISIAPLVMLLTTGAAYADKAKTAKVATAAQFNRTVELAARQPTSDAEVIDISCDDSDEDVPFCATDFADTCDAHGGGMSTNPDGSVTCSVVLPKAAVAPEILTAEVRSKRDFDRALGLKMRSSDGVPLVTTCHPGAHQWCTSGGFAKACDDAGGGMSTNPDGSVSCHVP